MIGTETPHTPDAPTAAESRLAERDLTALSALVDTSMPVSVEDFAADLVDRDIRPDGADRLRVRLHHVILPKLDDAGLIDYEAHEHEVTSTAGDVRLLG